MPTQNLFQNVIDSPVGSTPTITPVGQNAPQESLLSKGYHFFFQPVINLGEDISFLYPEQKAARTSIEQLRKMGGEQEAQRLLGELPEVPTFEKVIGDVAGTVLTGITMNPFGGAIGALKGLKGLPFLQSMARAGLTGAAYGGAFGLTGALSNKEGLQRTIEQTILGSVLGAPFGIAGELAFKGIGAVAGKAVAPIAGAAVSFAEKHPIVGEVVNFFRPVKAVLMSNYGEIGKTLAKVFETHSEKVNSSVGQVAKKLYEAGLIEAPRLTNKNLLSREEAWAGPNSLKDKLQGKVTLQEGQPFVTPKESAPNPKVEKAYQTADQIRNEVLVSAQKVGVVKQGVTAENYFPQITPDANAVSLSAADRAKGNLLGAEGSLRADVLENAVNKDHTFATIEEAAGVLDSWAEFVKGGGRIAPDNKWLQYLVKKGQAATIEEAAGKTMMEMKFRNTPMTPRAGALDYPRQYDFPFYDPDPRRVLLAYSANSLSRIHYAELLGPEEEILKTYIGKVEQLQGPNAAIELEKTVRQITGQISKNPSRQNLSVFFRALQVPKLTFAQIVNLGQSLNTLLSSDLGSLAYGLSKSFGEKGILNALESGALLNPLLRENLSYLGGGSAFADKWLRWTGFNWTENFNRTVAANAGQKYLEKQAARLIKNPNNGLARWRIQELNVNPDEVLKIGLTKEMKLIAGDTMSTRTQFLSRPMDLPGFASSPEGKVFFQFKNYAYQQVNFLKNKIGSDIATKNYAGVLRTFLLLGTVFPMTGEVLQDVRSLITQEKRPTNLLDRYLNDLANSGSWGLAIDLWSSARYGMLAENIIGPTLGTATKLTEATLQGNIDQLVKQLLQQTGVGRIPANLFMTKQGGGRESTLRSIQKLQPY